MSKKPKSRAATTGRPSVFTPKVAEKIIAGLSQGTPLTVICQEKGMPHPNTVRNWMKAKVDFAEQIALARDAGFDAIAMEALRIADDTSGDTIQTKHGEMPDKEWILRSKLRVETRLKLLAKWDPKRYGDKITQEISGPDGGPIGVSSGPDAEQIAEFTKELYGGFTGYRDDSGKTPVLDENAMDSLSYVIACFTRGEDVATGRPPREMGQEFARIRLIAARVQPPASFRGEEQD